VILDARGRPLRRAIGYLGGMVRVPAGAPPASELVVVGTPAEKEDEEKEDEEEEEEPTPRPAPLRARREA